MDHRQKHSVSTEELAKVLEPLIRRIIREELTRMVNKEPEIFYLGPGIPIYKDMEDINKRRAKGNIKLHTHKEVWGE